MSIGCHGGGKERSSAISFYPSLFEFVDTRQFFGFTAARVASQIENRTLTDLRPLMAGTTRGKRPLTGLRLVEVVELRR